MEIVRVWDESLGWVHEVWSGHAVLDRSKHRDELQEAYPDATVAGRVQCHDEQYVETF